MSKKFYPQSFSKILNDLPGGYYSFHHLVEHEKSDESVTDIIVAYIVRLG